MAPRVLVVFAVVPVFAAIFTRHTTGTHLDMQHVHARGAPRELGAEESPITDAYVSKYEVITKWPHKGDAFTQGLAFDEQGTLYESDGIQRRSAVRSINVPNGENIAVTRNSATDFGEGITVIGDKLVQLTWQNNVVHEYSLPSLTKTRSRKLACRGEPGGCKEGWGLAYEPSEGVLYMTDSTDKLFTLDPESLQSRGAARSIVDPRMGRAVYGVNELEWVEGELWGNVFPMYQGTASECIVRINATDASVIGWIDMRGLFGSQRVGVRQQPHNYVLNGIAYHKPSKRLYVTGKSWDHMYHVRVVPDEKVHQSAAHVASICSLGDASGLRG